MQKYIGDYLQFEELNCKVCQEQYGNNSHTPRVLTCGHTFCTGCLKRLVKKRPYCPDCRLIITNEDITTYPVVYILKQITESVKDFNLKNLENGVTYLAEDCNIFESHSAVVLNESVHFPSVGTCPLHLAPQQFWCSTCSLWICGSCSYLDHSSASSNSNNICKVIVASKQFKNMKQKQLDRIDEQMKELNKALAAIQNLTKLVLQESEAAKKLLSNNNLDDEHLDKYKAVLSTLASKKMELEAACEIVEDAKEKFDIKSLKQFHKSTKYLDNLWNSKKFPQLENELLEGIFSQILQKVPFVLMTKSNSITCSLSREGKYWYSPVKFENKEMIIPSLKEHSLSDSHIFPFNEVKGKSKDLRAFMRLSRQGVKLGSLEIKLFNNRLADQFISLCTGECGPCFRWTKFFASEGLFNRYLAGGDYEKNTGEGGAKIHQDISVSQLMRMEDGFVCGEESYQPGVQAQFKIFYKVTSSPFTRCPIGKLIKGLDLIQQIATSSDFKKVYIEECGIIVPINQCSHKDEKAK